MLTFYNHITSGQTRMSAANSRLPQWGLTRLNQVERFYQSLYLVDSELLRNRHLRVAAKRCSTYKQTLTKWEEYTYLNLKTKNGFLLF